MRRLILFCLMVLLPLEAVSTQPMFAILRGAATINGDPAKHSSAVFAGDRLKTGLAGSIVLQDRKASAQIGPSTDCVVQEHRIALDSGILVVRGSMIVSRGQLAIQGNSGDAHFEVSKANGEIFVRILEGSVAIHNGSANETLGAGQTRRLPVPEPAVKPASRIPTAVGISIAAAGVTAGTIASHLDDDHAQCITSGDMLCAFAQKR